MRGNSSLRLERRQSNLYFAAADEVTDEKSWEWLKQNGLKEKENY